MQLLDLAPTALTTLFVTVGPIEAAPIFLALTANDDAKHRRRLALTASIIAAIILVLFAIGGVQVLSLLQVGLPAFRLAGGILLLMMAADLLLAHRSSLSSITKSEEREAKSQSDIAVFPLAIPLIAGPGSMTAVVLLMSKAHGVAEQGVVIGCILAIIALTCIVMLAAGGLNRVLGVMGNNVIARVSGILLAALAMQYILDGLHQSGIFR
ncbi:MAG TPA: MarC family protein [Rhizomicrobium sp.]|nr:MarC family protein [Rhizomicrobium sp.]